MRIAILTLGCRTNQAESAGMAGLLRSRGHTVVKPDDTAADAVIINTCTVTSTADKKSRNAIRRLRKMYPDAILAVCGCLPQTEMLDGIEGIDLIGGTSDRAGFVEELERLLCGETTPPALPAPLHRGEWDTLPDEKPIGRSRVYLKIQDGCDNRCAYCKVPLARGHSRSRPVESVISAAKAVGKVNEIVLTGIEISSFKPSLARLTAEVCRAVDPVKVRLSSLNPNIIDDVFTAALYCIENFSPSFHLSLQSCCDKTLAAMGRRYGSAEIFSAFEHLRGAWPDVIITADIIVGFPGESDADFEETFNNLKRLSPDGLHIFPYSKRDGTAAASMEGQITRAVKTARAKKLQEAFPKGD